MYIINGDNIIASRTPANDFDAKYCSRMNRSSARCSHEHSLCAPGVSSGLVTRLTLTTRA
jgi:hypothetical protein